jgi:hypothetical protein
MGWTGSAV